MKKFALALAALACAGALAGCSFLGQGRQDDSTLQEATALDPLTG